MDHFLQPSTHSLNSPAVFGDLSSFSKSGRRSTTGRDASGVQERLKAERLRAMEALEKPRPSRLCQTRPGAASVRSSTNISELVTDETIDLNSSGSFALATPAPKGSNVSFEPAEITGRSTLCGRREKTKPSVSVADILKSSFVEKARLLEKKLQNASQLDASYHLSRINSTNLTDSFNCSRSLPRTADLSDLSLNGGGGFSFGSASVSGQALDESFAPAELMQSKLVQGEISWAQEFTAMPTATMSNQAIQKMAAPPPASDIETSVSK